MYLNLFDSGPEGFSVMTSTADFGHTDIMRLLVNAEVPTHWTDGNGWMALHAAVRQGHEEMVRSVKKDVRPCRHMSKPGICC